MTQTQQRRLSVDDEHTLQELFMVPGWRSRAITPAQEIRRRLRPDTTQPAWDALCRCAELYLEERGL